MFKLSKEADKIYLLHFDDRYDCAMSFLRYQEYYESDNPRFQNKTYTLASYIDWYSKYKSEDKNFSYPEDWSGFNIPLNIIDNVWKEGISDLNHYDYLMKGICELIKSNADSDKCYLIGISGEKNKSAYNHEMCHGLFYTNQIYFNDITSAWYKIPIDLREKLYSNITNLGYAGSSVIDESQAYINDGCSDYIWDGEKPKAIEEYFKQVIEIYKTNNVAALV